MGNPVGLGMYKSALKETPREAFNWRLAYSVICFGLMGAARGLDEGLISTTVAQKSFLEGMIASRTVEILRQTNANRNKNTALIPKLLGTMQLRRSRAISPQWCKLEVLLALLLRLSLATKLVRFSDIENQGLPRRADRVLESLTRSHNAFSVALETWLMTGRSNMGNTSALFNMDHWNNSLHHRCGELRTDPRWKIRDGHWYWPNNGRSTSIPCRNLSSKHSRHVYVYFQRFCLPWNHAGIFCKLGNLHPYI